MPASPPQRSPATVTQSCSVQGKPLRLANGKARPAHMTKKSICNHEQSPRPLPCPTSARLGHTTHHHQRGPQVPFPGAHTYAPFPRLDLVDIPSPRTALFITRFPMAEPINALSPIVVTHCISCPRVGTNTEVEFDGRLASHTNKR